MLTFLHLKIARAARQWYRESPRVHNTTGSSPFHIGSLFITLYFSGFSVHVFSICLSFHHLSFFLHCFLVVLHIASSISLKIMRNHMVRQSYEPVTAGYLNRKYCFIKALGRLVL